MPEQAKASQQNTKKQPGKTDGPRRVGRPRKYHTEEERLAGQRKQPDDNVRVGRPRKYNTEEERIESRKKQKVHRRQARKEDEMAAAQLMKEQALWGGVQGEGDIVQQSDSEGLPDVTNQKRRPNGIDEQEPPKEESAHLIDPSPRNLSSPLGTTLDVESTHESEDVEE